MRFPPLLALAALCGALVAAEVTAPPPELKAPDFYKKYISASGFPIVASEKVNDYALKEAAYLVDLMLAKRPDVREAMIKSGARMCIMAYNEFTTDLPEFAHLARSQCPELAGVVRQGLSGTPAPAGSAAASTDPLLLLRRGKRARLSRRSLRDGVHPHSRVRPQHPPPRPRAVSTRPSTRGSRKPTARR